MLLVLAMRAPKATSTKTNDKIEEEEAMWGGNKNYPTCHYSVDKTMNMTLWKLLIQNLPKNLQTNFM